MARLAASSNATVNPYERFRFLCANVKTKARAVRRRARAINSPALQEHAQLIAIVSLAVFICLIVLSVSIFGSLSIAYILCGVAVYALLFDSLIRRPRGERARWTAADASAHSARVAIR